MVPYIIYIPASSSSRRRFPSKWVEAPDAATSDSSKDLRSARGSR